MQRPHRSLGYRLQRRVTVLGGQLPPTARRVVRGLADRVGPLLTSGKPAAGPPSQAEVVTSFDAWQTIADLAAAVREVLVAGGIEVVQLERGGAVVLAVPREQRSQALAAIQLAPQATKWWAVRAGDRPVQPVRLAGATPARLKTDNLAVYRLLAAKDDTLLSDSTLAIQLQFWKTMGKRHPRPDGGYFIVGTRVAPSRNGVAPYLVPEQWREAQEHPERRALPDAPPHLLELNEPIDVVYTWVDGSDPSWLQRRASFDPKAGKLLAVDALDPSRTMNRDELRYSLRSLAMYAGWVRHVWVVTDGQVPAWLAQHPKLTVVHHREIFTDPTALPTFNSHSIESQLHHIDGLAEHFLYLNDDIFFGRPIRPELFFHGNGVAKFALSPIAIDREPVPGPMNGAMLAARQGRDFLERIFGRTVTHRMQHVPHAHQRSTLAEFEQRHPDLFAQVAHSRFRDPNDLSIPSDLGHYYGYARGRAVTSTIAFRYVDIGSPLATEYFENLLALRDQDCFCVNDVGGYSTPVDDDQVSNFLRRYFPVPSPFERAEEAV
jgi:hypothetical protein